MAAGCVVQGLNSFELFGGTSVDIAALAFFPKKSSTVPCAYGLAAGKEPSSLELVPLRAFANSKGVKLGSESKVELKSEEEARDKSDIHTWSKFHYSWSEVPRC